MKNTLQGQRRFLAWFLLLSLCLQRIIGFVEQDPLYVVFTDGGITAAENNLVEETQSGPARYPIDTSRVSFLKQATLAPHECRGSQEHPDYYYTVDHWPANYVKVVHDHVEEPHQQTPYNTTRTLNDKLSSFFYLDAVHLTLGDRAFFNTLLSRIPAYGDDPFITIHLPPPKPV